MRWKMWRQMWRQIFQTEWSESKYKSNSKLFNQKQIVATSALYSYSTRHMTAEMNSKKGLKKAQASPTRL